MFNKHRQDDTTRGKNMKSKANDAMSMFAGYGGLTDEEKREMKRRIMERIEQEDPRQDT